MSSLPLRELDGSTLRAWATAALRDLAVARSEIDALNVYPVPDGDTGTNLYLTFEAAVDAVAAVPADAGPRPILDAMTRGSLLGARGNSGVILSQMLRGLSSGLGEKPADAEVLALALQRAADSGYAAVAEPVEGTMLTVLRSAAAAAAGVASLPDLITAAAQAAREALARTPDQLQVLRDAGVVDAGGRGVCLLLDALEGVVTGAPVRLSTAPEQVPSGTPAHVERVGPSYELMFLLDAEAAAIPTLRDALTALGDSVVFAGGEPVWNVHAHVADVGAAIEAAMSAGQPHAFRVGSLAEATCRPADKHRDVVVVLDEPELTEVFASAGGAVPGGGQRVVSPADLAAALEDTASAELIVVPTDEAGYELARTEAEGARRPGLRIEVVPARVPVQAMAAIAAHDPMCRYEDDLLQMTAAAARCRPGAVNIAAEDAVTPAGKAAAGDALGSIDAEVVLIGHSPEQVACALVDRLAAAGAVSMTLVSGAEASPTLPAEVMAHVRRRHPDIDIAVHATAHPSVLLVGVE